MVVVQAALLGLTAVLLAAQLKPLKPEYAVYWKSNSCLRNFQ